MNKIKNGFTIIELVVVIAIIAILAAVVMLNITQYIAKSKDAAIIADFDSVITNSETYYTDNAVYGDGLGNGVCGTANPNTKVDPNSKIFERLYNDLQAEYSCNVSSDFLNWCACVELNVKSGSNTQYYCVDSNGVKTTTTYSCANECSTGGTCLH